jgi:hypothetical protein
MNLQKKHRNISIAVIGLVLIIGALHFGFRDKSAEPDPFTAEEKACLANLAVQFEPMLAAQSAQQNADQQQAIAAYGEEKSKPKFDAAMALSDYNDKMTAVKMHTLYCEQYAKCQPGRPQKATFDGCYAVFSDSSDEK